MRAASLLLGLATMFTAACGDDASTPDATMVDAAIPDAAPREVIMSTQALVPGALVEGIMTGGPGDLAVIRLVAPLANIGWNLHGHANGGTQVVFEEHDKAMVEYVFSPTSRADWYLLVRNEGSANLEVQFTVQLYGAITWAWQ